MNIFLTKYFGVVLSIIVLESSQANDFRAADLTMSENIFKPVEGKYIYNHPTAMFNDADFARVKKALNDNSAPQEVKAEFQALKNNTYTKLPYIPQPQKQIVRGDPTGTIDGRENYAYAMRDATAAYQLALLWKLTDEAKYADASINIMNSWANVCKEITSNDSNQMLVAGCQGYTFANAAEIMQTYKGWSPSKISKFKNWMVKVFASKNKYFLDKKDTNTCVYHYWSNWDLINMCSYLAIGILTENNEMVNYVVNYFHSGAGNGALKNLIQGTHIDPLGTGEVLYQNQESGRDQGHAIMSLAVTANLAQMTYTLYQNNKDISQLDFFAANDNALMKMGEYVALSNLKDGSDNANATGSWLITATEMPFKEYKYCIGCSCRHQNHGSVQTTIANDPGRGSARPGWEIIYNHYAKVKGLGNGYIYTQKFADKLRPEGGTGDSRYGNNSGAFDQLGWGTLMLYQW